MRHFLSLRRPALLLALLATLTLCREARAHKLEGEYRVLPGGKVRVESWFETGEPPRRAEVRIERPDGTPLFPEPGTMDEKGVYVFSYEKAERLRIVVLAGEGHRKELVISASELANPGTPPPGSERREEEPVRQRRYEIPFVQLLLGVTFLLALAAFVLGVRNARQLAELRRDPGGRRDLSPP
jgi:hypothetical protein